MLRPHLEQLIQHMEWADSLVWRCVLQSSQGEGDSILLGRLHHIHAVQRGFLQIWRDEPFLVPKLSDFDNLPSLATWAREYYPEATSHVQTMEEAELTRLVRLPWHEQWKERWGEVHALTLAETILQVSLHTAHHRGQVNTRLRELSAEPPLVDFIVWVCLGKPTPEWVSPR